MERHGPRIRWNSKTIRLLHAGIFYTALRWPPLKRIHNKMRHIIYYLPIIRKNINGFLLSRSNAPLKQSSANQRESGLIYTTISPAAVKKISFIFFSKPILTNEVACRISMCAIRFLSRGAAASKYSEFLTTHKL